MLKRLLLGVLALALLLPGTAHAEAQARPLKVTEAREMARTWARWANGLNERWDLRGCWKRGPNRARCRIRFHGSDEVVSLGEHDGVEYEALVLPQTIRIVIRPGRVWRRSRQLQIERFLVYAYG